MIPANIINQALYDYDNSTLTADEIASKYDITRATLYNHVKRKRKRPDYNLGYKHIAYGLYLNDKHPKAIAGELGFSVTTIYRWVRTLASH